MPPFPTRMPCATVMLGWQSRGVHAAADFLISRHASPTTLDLRRHVLITPTARAGRLLLATLIDRCAHAHLSFIPPRFSTPADLPSILLGPTATAAPDFLLRLAFSTALSRAPQDSLAPLLPHPPQSPAQWDAVASMLAHAHTLVAGAGLFFADIPERAGSLPNFAETDRWLAASAMQQDALAILHSWGLRDTGASLVEAVHNHTPLADIPITLIGIPTLPRALRILLDRAPGPVTALVWAPEDLATRFDHQGILIPEAWMREDSPLADDDLVFAADPADAANRLLAEIARRSDLASADILVVAPDPILADAVERSADLIEGIRFHSATGHPLDRTSPASFLRAVKAHLDRPTPQSLRALLAHPDVEQWRSQCNEAPSLDALDEWAAQAIASVLPETPEPPISDARALVDQLLAELRASPRPAPAWAAPIRAVLDRLYGAIALPPQDLADSLVAEALRALGADLALLENLSPSDLPDIPAAEALRLLLTSVHARRASPAPDAQAIEIVGWIDAALDPAPFLLLCGLNEGWIPSLPPGDGLLPDSLRAALGIETSASRAARDAYLLRALAATRPALKGIVLSRSADAEPLVPSRLVFRCTDDSLVSRANRFSRGDSPLNVTLTPPPAPLDRFAALTVLPTQPVTSMSVTSFRDYLASPYFFYLRHVLKLRESGPPPAELDGAAFGTIAHECLRILEAPELSACTDGSHLFLALQSRARQLARERFGPRPGATLAVQMIALEARLEVFAAFQAERAASGWRVEAVCWRPDAPVRFGDDDAHITLTGEIDRIDRHVDGRMSILDYKTVDEPRTPRRTHGPRKDGRWTDLQLPLYRHLAASIDGASSAELAYIVLPRDITKTALCPGEWSDDDLAAADDVARAVIRDVLQARFDLLGDDPPSRGSFGALCRAASLADDDDDEGGDP